MPFRPAFRWTQAEVPRRFFFFVPINEQGAFCFRARVVLEGESVLPAEFDWLVFRCPVLNFDADVLETSLAAGFTQLLWVLTPVGALSASDPTYRQHPSCFQPSPAEQPSTFVATSSFACSSERKFILRTTPPLCALFFLSLSLSLSRSRSRSRSL